MENFSYHVPFYVVTGGVSTQGQSSDLASGQVGFYDRQTWGVVSPSNNGNEFFFAQGVIGGKDWYGNPYTKKSHKSPFFYGKDIINISKSFPAKLVNEKHVVGFNGSNASKSLVYRKGKSTRIQIDLFDGPVYRMFGGPKSFTVSYSPDIDCPDLCVADCNADCESDCLDCAKHTALHVDLINNHPDLSKLGIRASVLNTPYTASTLNMTKYKLCICDEGDEVALQKVAAQYPTKNISRISRSGSTSCYEFCQKTTDAAPANFTYSGSVSLATCGTCEVGWTLSGSESTYFIRRPLSGSEDLSGTGVQQTYANTVAAGYDVVKTFDGSTAANTGTETITVTAHGFPTGTKVIYDNGGGTSITGLTDDSTYYVISTGVNTLQLATSYANAVASVPVPVDLTGAGVGAAHTLTSAISATYVGNDGSVATIQVVVSAGVPVTAILSDVVTFGSTKEASCTAPVGSSVAWVTNGQGLSSTRSLKIEALNRPDCANASDRIAELTTILSGVPGIKIGTLAKVAGVNCVDDYTVDQESADCLTEECLSNQKSFTYADVPGVDAKVWKVVVDNTVVAPGTNKCGILIEGAFYDPKFGNCSFNPSDFYETKPIRFELTILSEGGDACTFKNAPSVHKRQAGQVGRQSGEWVVREAIEKFSAYQGDNIQFDKNPRIREAFGQNMLSMVDRNANYVLYYVTFKSSYGSYTKRNTEARDMFTAVFAFKENDPAQFGFETQVIANLTNKSGVVMHINK